MMKTRNIARSIPFLVLTVAFLLPWAQSQQAPQSQHPAQTPGSNQSQPASDGQQTTQPQHAEDVPVTDGAAGSCSVEFTVTDFDAKPVFSALINVHIAYGFGGLHKLDMGVYTNSQGKGRFTGIPVKVRNPPLEFRATKGTLAGQATMNPASECQARREIVLQKSGN
jgi:hypothetical protein